MGRHPNPQLPGQHLPQHQLVVALEAVVVAEVEPLAHMSSEIQVSKPNTSFPRARFEKLTSSSNLIGYNSRVLNVDEPQEVTSQWSDYIRQQTQATQVPWENQTYNLLAGANQLLNGQTNNENREAEAVKERLRTVPIMMGNCLKLENSATAIPQYGLLGKRQDEDSDDCQYLDDDLIILNTNTPWTVFICGLQGAGKSHSLSVILGMEHSIQPCTSKTLLMNHRKLSHPQSEHQCASAPALRYRLLLLAILTCSRRQAL